MVFEMAFRARNLSGTFEERSPDSMFSLDPGRPYEAAYAGGLSSDGLGHECTFRASEQEHLDREPLLGGMGYVAAPACQFSQRNRGKPL